MSPGTPTHKRGSLHRLSHILQLASPTFSRPSLEIPTFSASRKKPPSPKAYHTQPAGVASLPADGGYQGGYTSTVSLASGADSFVSSPDSPLLASFPMPVDDFPLPRTDNKLTQEEKMKLIRKARKLSRVLGEIPVSLEGAHSSTCADEATRLDDVPEHPVPVAMRASPTPSSTSKVSASAKKAFRRSLTFGYGTGSTLQVQDMPRSKSFSALRPSLNHTTQPSINTETPPFLPITFPRPVPSECPQNVDVSSPDSADEPMIESEQDFREHLHGGSVPRSRKDSTSSSFLLGDQNQEQIQRQRVSKLTHRFGDNIPPDILIRATSPPPHVHDNFKAMPRNNATSIDRADDQLRRSTSLGQRSRRRRRPASLDLGTRDSLIAPTIALGQPASPKGDTLRRTKSLRTGNAKENLDVKRASLFDDMDTIFPNSYDPEALTEKQRALNVRRARKMAQLFGDTPPVTLFQITDLTGCQTINVVDARPSLDITDAYRYNRDSLATIVSIASLPSSTDKVDTRRRRNSSGSLSSSSELSAIDFAESKQTDSHALGVAPNPSMLEVRQDRVAAYSALHSIPERPQKRSKRPSTSPAPSRPSSPDSHSIRTLSVSHVVPPPRTPPTPPPFSNFIDSSITMVPSRPSTASIDAAPVDFQARRRRAVKLSKFFGVEVNTLVGALPTELPSPPIQSISQVVEAPTSPITGSKAHRLSSVTVAGARNRRRFLGHNEEDDVQELDMTDVIEQLRRMKSH